MRRMSSPLQTALVALFICVIPLLLPIEAAAKTGSHAPKLLASKYVVGSTGGVVKSRALTLRIPPGVIQGSGWATIARTRRGIYDVHIAAPWKGVVSIKFHRQRGAGRYFAHRIGKEWLLTRINQRTRIARVANLSHFSIVKNVIAKIKIGKCFRGLSRGAMVSCLSREGVQITIEVLNEVIGLFGPHCEEPVFASIGPPLPGGDYVINEAAKNALDSCEAGHAGSPRPGAIPILPTLPPLDVDPIAPINPVPTPQPPKPYSGNLRAVVYGGGHVGVAFDVGWAAGRDPVVCHFYRDGVEVFTAQCGTHSSKQFYGVPAGTHTWHAVVTDFFGVASSPTNSVTVYSS